MGWYVTVACRSCPLYKSSLGVYGTSSQGGCPGGGVSRYLLWSRSWHNLTLEDDPIFFRRFCELGTFETHRKFKNGGLMARREKDKPDLKTFRLALVNEHCSHCWEGKRAVLHQKVWHHGHAADCQIVACSWKEVLDVLWRFYRDSRSQKWDRMEFIESTSFSLELISVHVVVLFPIRNTVTPRLFNTNLRKDYSLINGSTALLATTFRGTLAVSYMSTNQIRNSCRGRLRTWQKGNVGALKTLLRARGDPHYFGTSSNRDVMKRSCIPERLGIWGFELEHLSKFVERCRCHLWEQTSPPGFSKSCCRNPRIKHQKKSLDACGVVIHSKIRTLKKQGSPLHLCRFFLTSVFEANMWYVAVCVNSTFWFEDQIRIILHGRAIIFRLKWAFQ